MAKGAGPSIRMRTELFIHRDPVAVPASVARLGAATLAAAVGMDRALIRGPRENSCGS